MTKIPQIGLYGWTEVPYTITRTPKDSPADPQGPPPGFTTVVQHCHICGPHEKEVTVTLPCRGPDRNTKGERHSS